jgi:hypothetical protein
MTRSGRRIISVAIPLSGVLLQACPKTTAIWVTSHSTVRDLQFDLGEQRNHLAKITIDFANVAPCSDTAANRLGPSIWWITAEDHGQPINHLRYGDIPAGFVSKVPAGSLGVGCYVITIAGTGSTRFRVLPNGTVLDDGPPW